MVTCWCSPGASHDTCVQGMLQLHSKHIIHRDLKSPNLLVDKHWRVKIGDFNLSRIEDTQEKTTSITANNPRWLAPEVISKQVRLFCWPPLSHAPGMWDNQAF